VTLLLTSLEAICRFTPPNLARIARFERAFDFGPPRANAIFVSERAELSSEIGPASFHATRFDETLLNQSTLHLSLRSRSSRSTQDRRYR